MPRSQTARAWPTSGTPETGTSSGWPAEAALPGHWRRAPVHQLFALAASRSRTVAADACTLNLEEVSAGRGWRQR